jgi:phospholipid/cholesterol/gamma-HCH transport system ATP-binding protein
MTATLDRTAEIPFAVAPGSPVVEFLDVHLGFDDNHVLKALSFTVAAGEQRIILGPAGVGKSLILKLANGLLAPDSGEVRIFGRDIAQISETDMYALRAHIGMVFQESALFDSLDVEDNVAYRLHEERMPEEQTHERVVEALKFVALEGAIAKFPSELSGGMRRRVSIARAIITQPELILYDSPTGGLDPITSTTIIELVVKQRDVAHTTSLLITHRLQDAFTVATHRYNTVAGRMESIPDNGIDPSTRFLVLHEGRAIFDGSTQELVRTTDPWLRAFLS